MTRTLAILLFTLSAVEGLAPAAHGAPAVPDQMGLAAKASLLESDALKWMAVVGLPPGAEFAVVGEDPVTHGVEALVRFPASYHVPPHWHSHLESMVVIRGKLWVTIEEKRTSYGSEAVVRLPAGLLHAFDTGWRGCTFFLRTDKPFDLFYQHPEDSKQ